ncbi:MAG: hypothetical protein Q7K43_01750 [Candidatus Woesearchaeota archaeon]|nr:hypothetical protein [Candidatus Woesearchaeota archaeon]
MKGKDCGDETCEQQRAGAQNNSEDTCGSPECEKECSGACDDGMTQAVLSVANEAWAEVLKEKMKKEYEKTMSAEMQALAEVGAKSFIGLMQGKTSAKADLKAHVDKMLKKA